MGNAEHVLWRGQADWKALKAPQPVLDACTQWRRRTDVYGWSTSLTKFRACTVLNELCCIMCCDNVALLIGIPLPSERCLFPPPPSPTPHPTSNYSLYTVFGPVVDDTLHTAPVVGCDDVSNPVWYTSSSQLPMATYPPTLSTLTLTLRFSLLLIHEVRCTTPKKHEQQRPLVSNVGQ